MGRSAGRLGVDPSVPPSLVNVSLPEFPGYTITNDGVVRNAAGRVLHLYDGKVVIRVNRRAHTRSVNVLLHTVGFLPSNDILPGTVFTRLTVISVDAETDSHGDRWATCACSCGYSKRVRLTHLRTGRISSCGCRQREVQGENATRDKPWLHVPMTHGHTSRKLLGTPSRAGHATPTYRSWVSMKNRCLNPNSSVWGWYGGAIPPVRVCDRWLVFENFLADMGERPAGTTLSRFADAGDYEPGNVAWHTKRQQGAERRKAIAAKRKPPVRVTRDERRALKDVKSAAVIASLSWNQPAQPSAAV